MSSYYRDSFKTTNNGALMKKIMSIIFIFFIALAFMSFVVSYFYIMPMQKVEGIRQRI